MELVNIKLLDQVVPMYDYIEGEKIIIDAVNKASGYVKGTNLNPEFISDVICTFDIETTKVKNLDSEKTEGKYSHFNFCFCWQFCIMDLTTGEYSFIFGRNIEEFFDMMWKVQEFLYIHNFYIKVFVHNLAYEYNNLAEYFNALCPNSAFFKDSVHPLMIGSNIEFRCSYQLTHKSLAMLSKEVGLRKGGDFDYNKPRHSLTPLTDDEIEYCFRDVYNLAVWLRKEVINYGSMYVKNGWKSKKCHNSDPHLAYLPLTQTGYVRTDVKKNFSSTKGIMRPYQYHLDINQYRYCKSIFRGGDTHANHRHAGDIFENIYHRDFTSAYPSVMLLEEFPAYNFEKMNLTTDNETNKSLLYRKIKNGRACLMTVVFKGLKIKDDQSPYIAKSMLKWNFNLFGSPYSEKKALNDSTIPLIYDNGRVLQSPYCMVSICEQDLLIINNEYTYEDMYVVFVAHTSKAPLPNELRKVICKYFYNKTRYKGVDGSEYVYLLAKQMLNGIYGLSATSLEHDMWYVDRETLEVISEDTEYKQGRVLPYIWAIYITAYVRRNLNYFKSILGDAFIYCDTDSIFYSYKDGFEDIVEEYNKNIEKRLEALAIELGDRDLVIPKNPKDVEQHLGVFLADKDYKIDKFITIGAKRYVTLQGDELNVTISGLTDTKGYRSPVTGEWHNGANVDYIINHYKQYGDIFEIMRKVAIDKNFKLTIPYRREKCWGFDEDGNEVFEERNVGKLCNYVERGNFSGIINDGNSAMPVFAQSSMVLVETDITITRDKTLGALIDGELINCNE